MRKYFEFYNGTKINCGDSALTTLGTELSYLGCKKPLLLCSASAEKLGAVERVCAFIPKESAKEVQIYAGVPTKVDVDIVNEIKKTYLEKECDGIIALGGDGVMDTAKCLKMFLAQECEEILPIVSMQNQMEKEIPMIAIPTENGSGKEANGYFEAGEYHVATRCLIPNVVIIDEDTAMTAPTRVICACGAYALANAIEAYIEVEEADPSEIYAEKAVRLLSANLLKAIEDSDDEEACRATALASTLAGIAYGNAPYGAAHALAEGISDVCGEPLEEMFGLTLVPAMKKARQKYDDRIKNLLLSLTNPTVFAETPDSERSIKAISTVEDILTNLNKLGKLPTKITQTKIARESFGNIAEAAAGKRSAITAFNPITKEEFIELLNDAY